MLQEYDDGKEGLELCGVHAGKRVHITWVCMNTTVLSHSQA